MVTLKLALTYPASWLSQVRVTRGSTAIALTVPMPLTVSTKNAWLSAPRANFSSRRLRSTGVMNAEISTYMGNEITTIRVSQLLYQNMTDKKTTVNRRSKTEVSAWPVSEVADVF